MAAICRFVFSTRTATRGHPTGRMLLAVRKRPEPAWGHLTVCRLNIKLTQMIDDTDVSVSAHWRRRAHIHISFRAVRMAISSDTKVDRHYCTGRRHPSRPRDKILKSGNGRTARITASHCFCSVLGCLWLLSSSPFPQLCSSVRCMAFVFYARNAWKDLSTMFPECLRLCGFMTSTYEGN